MVQHPTRGVSLLELPDDLEWFDSWLELDNMADIADLPRQWVVCPMCAKHSWRLPPHGFKPCPMAVSMAEAAGLKLDAERMTAVRAGVHLQDMGAAMRAYFEEQGLRAEEDDDDNE